MPARRTIDSRDARRLMVGMRVLSRRFCLSESDEAGCCGVTRAQAATLEALSGGGQLRLGELGRRLGIRPSTLTRNLARLEEQGLVRRIDDASDGRACCAALTEAGKRTVMGVGRREAVLARAVLERIPAEQRGRALEGLDALLSAVRQATESCCPGAFEHLMEQSQTRRKR
jgi:DNA-binding MarR family transcriptional regulator